MPADLVMAAATFDGRAKIGFDVWAEGEPADVVVYREDPEVNIETLREPLAVFASGVRVI